MIPNKRIALQELEIAGKLNPGQWTEHSKNVALAAYHIANNCPQINANTAYVVGLLHDIRRRTGIAAVRHIIDGYDYAVSKGWGEVARICLTHSFPIKDIEADIGKKEKNPVKSSVPSYPNDNYISFEETNLHRLYSAPPAGFSCGRFFVYEKMY